MSDPTFYKISSRGDVVPEKGPTANRPFKADAVLAHGAALWMTQLMILLPKPETQAHIPSYLFRAAQEHAENTGEPDHEVGDLQGLLAAAWDLMTPYQRHQFMRSPQVLELPDLDEDLRKELVGQTAEAYQEWLGNQVEIEAEE